MAESQPIHVHSAQQVSRIGRPPKNPPIQIDDVFGRWTVNELPKKNGGYAMCQCRCKCGTVRNVAVDTLHNGTSTSCGCYAKEVTSKAKRTHGGSRLPEYCVWQAMIIRCTNPNYQYFKDYGGRGITVCERWLNSFPNFLADMGRRPTPKHEIDRRDNNGNYEPTNCRWVTRIENQHNNRRVKLYEFNGQKMVLGDLSKQSGIPRSTLVHRLKIGWSLDKALTHPIKTTGFAIKPAT